MSYSKVESHMKFTVLLSLYYKESAEYFSECLTSIENNTLQPDQIIIIYDGPVGDILESTVSKFQGNLPIEVFPLSKNVGLGNALNYGLQFCRNDVVFRMDTDDICMANRFQKQLLFMQNNPDVAILGSATEEFDGLMVVSQGIRFSVSEHEEIKRYSRKRNPFNHMTVVFRKSVIEKVGGYQHHFLMEDYNLWLRVISSGYKTHNLKDVLVRVRAGNNMLIRRKGLRYIKSEIQLAKLKYTLDLDSITGVISCALLRIVPRLLPVSLLKQVYKLLRK